METLIGFLQDNIGIVLGGLFSLTALFLVGDRLAKWKFANEIIFFAWDSAEKHGLLTGARGNEKLAHFIEAYRSAYGKKWGKQPSDPELERAKEMAGELSVKEKVYRLSDPT